MKFIGKEFYMKQQNGLTLRKKRALETYKRLFETSLKLFAEKGYDMVSVDEIVTQAGTSKGAFYTHFKSKDQVIIEQFKQFDEYYVGIYHNYPPEWTATEKLLTLIKEQHRLCAQIVGLDTIKVVYYSLIRNNQEKKSIIDEERELYTIVHQIMEQGQKSGEFRDDISASELTRDIVRCMRGMLYDWCLYDGAFDLVEEGQKFFLRMLEGLQKKKHDH
jgi:AcrR family transcriptional regulator